MAYRGGYRHRPTTKEDRQVQIVTPREPTREACTNTRGPWTSPSQQQWTNSRSNSMAPRQQQQQQQQQYGSCGPNFCGFQQMQNRPKEAGQQRGTVGGGGGSFKQSISPQKPGNGSPGYFCTNGACCRPPAQQARGFTGTMMMTWDQLRSLDLSNCTITITCGGGGSRKDAGVGPKPEVQSMYGPVDTEGSEPVSDRKNDNPFGLDKEPIKPNQSALAAAAAKRNPRGLQVEPRTYPEKLAEEKEREEDAESGGAETKAASASSSQKSTSSKSSSSGESSASGSDDEGSSTTASGVTRGAEDGTSEDRNNEDGDDDDKSEAEEGRRDRRGTSVPTDGGAMMEAELETFGEQLVGSTSTEIPANETYARSGSEAPPLLNVVEPDATPKGSKVAVVGVEDSDANSNTSSVQQQQAKKVPSPTSLRKESNTSSRTRTVNHLINGVIGELVAKKTPVVWVYGYTQASLAETKGKCLRQIADEFGFEIVNLDLFYEKCTEINENAADHSVEESQIATYGHQVFAKAGVYKNLDTFDVCAIYKAAIVLKQITASNGSEPKGFILDEFPVNSLEGSQAESELPHSPVGIYFLNSKCSESPDCETEVEPPMRDLRGATYNERAVNKAADDFGFKTVKVLNAEELDASQIGDIIVLLEKHINGEGLELHEAVEVEEEASTAVVDPPPAPAPAEEPKSKKKRKRSKK